jgi:outer membrane beta-barrel protein
MKFLMALILIFTISESLAEDKKNNKTSSQENEFLWLDPDKAIHVLQKKKHPKKNRIYTDIGLNKGLKNKFSDQSGVKFKGGYYVTENIAIEFQHSKNHHVKNIDYKNIKKVNGVEPFMRNINSSSGLNVIYSPFYGKINTFNKIFYIDWYFGVGGGTMEIEDNQETVDNPGIKSTFKSEKKSYNNVKTGIKAFMGKNSYLNFEYNDQYYKTKDPGEQNSTLKNNNEVVLGIGFIF